MKLAIILSSVILTGCATPLFVDECVNPPVKEKKARDPNERVYGWTKEEFAAMPKYCGHPRKRNYIIDRNGRVIGIIR